MGLTKMYLGLLLTHLGELLWVELDLAFEREAGGGGALCEMSASSIHD